MELCSYRTSPNLLQFSPSILSYPLSNSLSLSKSLLYPTLKNNSCSSSRLLRPISLIKRPSAAPATSPSNHTVLEKLPADIRVTETPQPNSTVKLRVEVPPAVCEDCYKRVLNEFMKQAKVPGFRPGKNVPESILIGFVGEQSVQKATIESILKRTLPHAMESVGGRALKDSIRIVTHFSEMEKAYSSQNSLSYDVVVDVAPEVKWVPEGGYTNLVIKVEMDNDIDAHMASERELRRRHKSLGSIRIVIDRGLQVGDVAVLDISATTVDQDELNIQKIPSAESKGFHFDTEDSDNILPGFLDLIIGIQRGETKSFQLAFPDSWKQEHLRGVNAQFTVVCTELFYRDMPELNDSISDKLLQGCTTLEEVKESLTQRFIEIEKTAKEQATDNAILDQICKMIEVDIPRSLFEEQGRGFYGSKLLQIQAQMKLNEQQLASLSSPKSVNEYLESQRKDIMNVIKQNLAVGDIFKRENLQFSTEELAKEVENSIAEFKSHNQEYDEERVKEQVQEILEGAKVLEWLREHSVIEYTTR